MHLPPDYDWHAQPDPPENGDPFGAALRLLAAMILSAALVGLIVLAARKPPPGSPIPTPMKLNSHHMPEVR